MVGPDILQEIESMVKTAKQNLKLAQDQQKRYAYHNRIHK
jgi:hypothetical protein